MLKYSKITVWYGTWEDLLKSKRRCTLKTWDTLLLGPETNRVTRKNIDEIVAYFVVDDHSNVEPNKKENKGQAKSSDPRIQIQWRRSIFFFLKSFFVDFSIFIPIQDQSC